MARIPILTKNGKPTGMFWSDQREENQRLKTVFRTTDDGTVQRSKSLQYDVKRGKLQRV